MDPVYILLSVVLALIGLGGKFLTDVYKRCHETREELVSLQTKMDIYLEHVGFDTQKVNKAIKEHMTELKQNGKPRVGGCIHIDQLRHDKEQHG